MVVKVYKRFFNKTLSVFLFGLIERILGYIIIKLRSIRASQEKLISSQVCLERFLPNLRNLCDSRSNINSFILLGQQNRSISRNYTNLKIRIIGRKNQPFARFIFIPQRTKMQGIFTDIIGFWDIRLVRTKPRNLSLNVFKILLLFLFGGLPNKNTLKILFYFVIDFYFFRNKVYFHLLIDALIFFFNE